MVAAGGFLGMECRVWRGPGGHVGLTVLPYWVLLSCLVGQLLLPQTHFNQLCLAWLSQHILAAVTGLEHWANCQACCKIHWNFI